jgi:hypothetical protein
MQCSPLLPGGGFAGGHEEVAVSLGVGVTEGEGALHIGADEVVAERGPRLVDELGQDVVELGDAGRGGYAHGVDRARNHEPGNGMSRLTQPPRVVRWVRATG